MPGSGSSPAGVSRCCSRRPSGCAAPAQLSLTGNFLDAETALAWGLVNHVVPHDDLLPFATRLAADIVSIDQAAGRRVLATYAEGPGSTAGDALDLESRVAGEWLSVRRRDTADEIERRRAAIIDRGRIAKSYAPLRGEGLRG